MEMTSIFFMRLSCLAILLGLVSCNDLDTLSPAKRCHYDMLSSPRLFTADCSSLDLDTVPGHTNPDVEVLDFSNNRLRVLHADTFAHLPNLKFLYLFDNKIKSIDPLTFEPLSKLTTLDLKGNLLNRLDIVYPKSLVRLYLGNMRIDHLNLQKAHSLQYLSLQKSNLPAIPDIGFLPNLVELDVTDNAISNMSSIQLAPFCRLTVLHMDEDVFTPDMLCDCLQLQHYATVKHIFVKNLVCKPVEDSQIDSCPPPLIVEETSDRFASCQAEWDSRQFPHWAMSGLLFVVCIASVAVGIILWRKRRDNMKRKKRSNATGDTEAKNKEPEAKSEPALLA